MPKKLTPLQLKIEALAKQHRASDYTVRKGSKEVPAKKKSKPLGYKMQNTFEKNLRSVPGGSRSRAVSELRMIEATGTGCKVASQEQAKKLGPMRSMRNANTTQGSYVTTIVEDESFRLVSDAQGRRVYGR